MTFPFRPLVAVMSVAVWRSDPLPSAELLILKDALLLSFFLSCPV